MTKEQILLLSIIICSVLVVFLIILLILKKAKKKKNKSIDIDQSFVENIIDNLGGKENIISIDVVETKLKITSKDLKKVNLDNLKALTSYGVFVSGNTIKILFKFDSKALKHELDRYKGV